MKHVAFITSGWLISTYIMQLVEAFTDLGIKVDIYTDNNLPHSIDAERVVNNPQITIRAHNFIIYSDYTRKQCQDLLMKTGEELSSAASAVEYDFIIGVEKIGACLGWLIARNLHKPFVYWSLELYDMQHSRWSKGRACPEFWLEMEAFAHKKASVTIIQDEDRAHALAGYTGVTQANYLYLPITIGRAEVVPQGGFFLHDLCSLPHNIKILLQFGHNRMQPEEVFLMAQAMPDNWRLVLHGLHMNNATLAQHHKLIISRRRLSASSLPQLIASASIGLVYYQATDINDVLTAHSSEKLARYLAAGVPVLAHDVGNFASVFSKNNAGLTFSSPQQVGVAVSMMEKRYDVFQKAALKAGEKYIFENVGSEIVNTLYDICCKN